MPYAEAAVFIFSGVNERFRRSRTDENVAKFHTFYRAVSERKLDDGKSLLDWRSRTRSIESPARMPARSAAEPGLTPATVLSTA